MRASIFLVTAFSAILAAAAPTNSSAPCAPRPPGPACDDYCTCETVPNFYASEAYSCPSEEAITPADYSNTYFQQNAASQYSKGYLTTSELDVYDPAVCAARCTKNSKCKAFNIFFERDPLQVPGPACPNPWATVNIKCSLFSADALPFGNSALTNKGQFREQFQVAITGSNGYISTPGTKATSLNASARK